MENTIQPNSGSISPVREIKPEQISLASLLITDSYKISHYKEYK